MTSITDPFLPSNASTVNLPASSSSSNVALPSRNSNPYDSLRIRNTGTVEVFLSSGTSSSVTASTTADMPIGPGNTETFACPQNITHIAGITLSGSATVYFTFGKGA